MASNVESTSVLMEDCPEGDLETPLSVDNDLFAETLNLIEVQSDEVEAEVQASIEEVHVLPLFYPK